MKEETCKCGTGCYCRVHKAYHHGKRTAKVRRPYPIQKCGGGKRVLRHTGSKAD